MTERDGAARRSRLVFRYGFSHGERVLLARRIAHATTVRSMDARLYAATGDGRARHVGCSDATCARPRACGP